MRANQKLVFFFNDTATTEIYTLSLHDALPIFARARTEVREAEKTLTERRVWSLKADFRAAEEQRLADFWTVVLRSEEHTSELQSRQYLVCRLLLEKKTNTLMPSSFSILSSFLR